MSASDASPASHGDYDAVRRRRAVVANHLVPSELPALRQFAPRSLMAAPLLVFGEVIGATTYLHDSEDEFFNDDLAAKATILAGQLGSLLEATRLGEVLAKSIGGPRFWPMWPPLSMGIRTRIP